MTRDEQMWEAVEQVHGELSRREAFVTLTALEWADKTMMTHEEEFKELVKRMREAQVKRFEFYTDDGWWADRAIELEKEVDEYLKKMEQAGSSREG